MRRNESETYILNTIAKYGEVSAMRGLDFGNRLLNAARKLQDEGLVKIVDWRFFEKSWRSSYRVIATSSVQA